MIAGRAFIHFAIKLGRILTDLEVSQSTRLYCNRKPYYDLTSLWFISIVKLVWFSNSNSEVVLISFSSKGFSFDVPRFVNHRLVFSKEIAKI